MMFDVHQTEKQKQLEAAERYEHQQAEILKGMEEANRINRERFEEAREHNKQCEARFKKRIIAGEIPDGEPPTGLTH